MTEVLRVAAGVGDPALASALLSPLHLETFDAKTAPLFAPLLAQFGQRWSRETLSALSIERNTRMEWLTRLPLICEQLRDAGEGGRELGQWLASQQWEWLAKELHHAEGDRAPSQASARLSALVPPLAATLESTAVVDAAELQEMIVQHLAAAQTERRVELLTALLRRGLDFPPLHELCTESFAEWLNAPSRADSDWSIAADLGCRCERCRTLGAFLAAPDRKVLEWPLAEQHRAHVHRVIEGYELPVAHQTRRTGRPYTLVLTKHATLLEREAARRRRWADDLAWLRNRIDS
jgi:hypothetical protein